MPLPTPPSAAALAALAHHYNTAEFIKSDPVQFPHRYTAKKDIEVSAFLTSWISWGNRKQIIRTAEMMDSQLFGHKPYGYLMSRHWELYRNDSHCFYRTVQYNDFYNLMERLWAVYQEFEDLEDCVVHHIDQGLNPAEALSRQFNGISGIADASKSSPCKRLWFFLRWMVRRDKIVDLGVWQKIPTEALIIPLDTHVHNVALQMGITNRRSADKRTAEEITAFFRRIFPNDPALGDYALFGYGIEHGV